MHIKLLGDLPVSAGRAAERGAEARKAAGYLGKYVGKSFGEKQRARSLKRYEVAEGFAPRVLHLTGRSADEVTEMACEYCYVEFRQDRRSRVWPSTRPKRQGNH